MAAVAIDNELDRLIERYPAGSRVVVSVDGNQRIGRTRGVPLKINGVVYLYIEGVAGAVRACDVRPSYVAWVRFRRGKKKGRWVYGCWLSKEAMDSEIDQQLQRDPRIGSFEVRNTQPVDLDV
jgi:hypothetical protein